MSAKKIKCVLLSSQAKHTACNNTIHAEKAFTCHVGFANDSGETQCACHIGSASSINKNLWVYHCAFQMLQAPMIEVSFILTYIL